MRLNLITIIPASWAGLIFGLGALLLWNIGNLAAGANKASASVYLRLLMIIVLAMIILDEELSLYHEPSFAFIIAEV